MKVKTQVPCERCDGSGYIPFTDDGGRNCKDLCLDCEGKGYQEAWSEQLPAQVADHEEELALNQAAFFALIDLVDRQQERIKRLEKVVLSMACGTESSIGDDTDDGAHTYWVYPSSGTKALQDAAAASKLLLDEPRKDANQAGVFTHDDLWDAVDDLLYASEVNGYPDDHFNIEHLAALREIFLALSGGDNKQGEDNANTEASPRS